MSQNILVKATNPNRGSFYEEDPAHPGGSVWVRGEREVEAAQTRRLLRAIGSGQVTLIRKLSGAPAEKFVPGSEVVPDGTEFAEATLSPPITTDGGQVDLATAKRAELDAEAKRRNIDPGAYSRADDLRAALVAQDEAQPSPDTSGGAETGTGDPGATVAPETTEE